jgi:hypothetical protein
MPWCLVKAQGRQLYFTLLYFTSFYFLNVTNIITYLQVCISSVFFIKYLFENMSLYKETNERKSFYNGAKRLFLVIRKPKIISTSETNCGFKSRSSGCDAVRICGRIPTFITKLHGVTIRKTSTSIFTAVNT